MFLKKDQNNEKEMECSDNEIVKKIQNGDVNAYNILVIKYQHKVVDIAYKFVKNYVDANDIAQEAFIKAYRAIWSFRGDSNFYTWLYRIVVNAAKTYLETNSRHKNVLDIDAPEIASQDAQGFLSSTESPDKIMETEELQSVIMKAFSDLPDDLRQAITLREIDGLSYEDIAVIMKTPVGTVRSRIFRARQFIEERMAKLNGH